MISVDPRGQVVKEPILDEVTRYPAISMLTGFAPAVRYEHISTVKQTFSGFVHSNATGWCLTKKIMENQDFSLSALAHAILKQIKVNIINMALYRYLNNVCKMDVCCSCVPNQ